MRRPVFTERRDNTIIRLFLDSGMRLAELANLTVNHLDLETNVAVVLGKWAARARAPTVRETAMALDRYLRMRRRHPRAREAALWLGERGSARAATRAT